jgi:hypothetical protein
MKIHLSRAGSVSLITVLATFAGCKTAGPKPEATAVNAVPARAIASAPAIDLATTAFGKQLVRLKLAGFEANLHAHHIMDVHGSKKNPMSLEEALAPGPCRAEKGTFPGDDGKPCRDEGDETDVTIPPRTKLADGSPDVTDYFRQACEYGTGPGELDVLFVTPHTKNGGVNEGQIVTSSSEAQMQERQAMLASMNPDRLGRPKFLCGLGQEASSISSGNHINIFGQFHAGAVGEEPFFFPAGDFKTLYPAVKARNAAGGKVFLQFNHPDVKRDLAWGSFADLRANKKRLKEALNDYGLDDFAPVGCYLGKLAADSEECKDVPAAESLTENDLRKTFANIRAAAGDPFRLIEIIPPGAAKEGGADTDGDGTVDQTGDVAFGATTNTKTNFRAVQHRADANTYEDGVYDWAFYLAMGFKLAPTADQDNHHMNWGTATASRTGILAANLREGSILDALNARRVYASEDRNAKVLLSQLTGTTRTLMGGTVKTSAPSTKIQIGYYDPDGTDATAKVRLYYYRTGDKLPLGSRAASKGMYRTVSFDAKGKITLPAIDAADRSEHDLLPIRSGQVVGLNLPLTKGVQWVFAEIVQDGDLDKTWTAPIWIERK